MALSGLSHLLFGANDALLVQVDLEPIVLVPTDEEPHVALAVQILQVDLAQDSSRGDNVKQTDDYPGVLAAKIPHGVRWIGEETLPRDYFNSGIFTA